MMFVTFNRTIKELKHLYRFDVRVIEVAFNRTIKELKLSMPMPL